MRPGLKLDLAAFTAGVIHAVVLFAMAWALDRLAGVGVTHAMLVLLALNVGGGQFRFIRYRRAQDVATNAHQRANVELWESQQRVNRALARDLQALRDSTRAAELAPQGMLRNGTTRVN